MPQCCAVRLYVNKTRRHKFPKRDKKYAYNISSRTVLKKNIIINLTRVPIDNLDLV